MGAKREGGGEGGSGTGGVDGTHRQAGGGEWLANEGGGRKGEERGGWKWAEEAAGSFIITEDWDVS